MLPDLLNFLQVVQWASWFQLCCLSSLLGWALGAVGVFDSFLFSKPLTHVLVRNSNETLIHQVWLWCLLSLLWSIVGSLSEVRRHFFTSPQEHCHSILRYLKVVSEDREVQGSSGFVMRMWCSFNFKQLTEVASPVPSVGIFSLHVLLPVDSKPWPVLYLWLVKSRTPLSIAPKGSCSENMVP